MAAWLHDARLLCQLRCQLPMLLHCGCSERVQRAGAGRAESGGHLQ